MPAGAIAPAARTWFIVAVVLGLLNAAVGAAYYLRIVAAMYFRAPPAAPAPAAPSGRGPRLAALACTALVLAIGFYPRPWITAAGTAAEPGPAGGDVKRSAARRRGTLGAQSPTALARKAVAGPAFVVQ